MKEFRLNVSPVKASHVERRPPDSDDEDEDSGLQESGQQHWRKLRCKEKQDHCQKCNKSKFNKPLTQHSKGMRQCRRRSRRHYPAKHRLVADCLTLKYFSEKGITACCSSEASKVKQKKVVIMTQGIFLKRTLHHMLMKYLATAAKMTDSELLNIPIQSRMMKMETCNYIS